MSDARRLLGAMVRHLPPSASALRLLDFNGAVGAVLAESRPDVSLISVSGYAWSVETSSADAVAIYDVPLLPELLAEALRALRPGGRLIAVEQGGEIGSDRVAALETAGFTRILVEAALEDDESAGVLMRGEKPHVTADTHARIQVAAERDHAADFAGYPGRYVFLLIRQKPNKPVWALASDEVVTWEAVAVERAGETLLLAFSSLPRAVAFMQPAVLAGTIKDVNKVAKFRRERLSDGRALLNPTLEQISADHIIAVPVDPQTAETPDE
jgi:SAM-dependent methyltransferase